MGEMIQSQITQFCGKCEEERTFTREMRESTVQIRGEPTSAQVPVLVCEVCRDVQPDSTPGADTMRPFYDAYRQKHGLLSPAEIMRIRDKYGMSREAFSLVLGMSPTTVYRYELGALQDEVHDNLMRSCDSPVTMIQLAERRKATLSPLQVRRFHEALTELTAEKVSRRVHLLEQLWESQSHSAVQRWYKVRGGQSLFSQGRPLASGDVGGLRSVLFFVDILSLDFWGKTVTGWFPAEPGESDWIPWIHSASIADSTITLSEQQERLYEAILDWSNQFSNERELKEKVTHEIVRRLARRWTGVYIHRLKPCYHLLLSAACSLDEDDAEIAIRIPSRTPPVNRPFPACFQI